MLSWKYGSQNSLIVAVFANFLTLSQTNNKITLKLLVVKLSKYWSRPGKRLKSSLFIFWIEKATKPEKTQKTSEKPAKLIKLYNHVYAEENSSDFFIRHQQHLAAFWKKNWVWRFHRFRIDIAAISLGYSYPTQHSSFLLPLLAPWRRLRRNWRRDLCLILIQNGVHGITRGSTLTFTISPTFFWR